MLMLDDIILCQENKFPDGTLALRVALDKNHKHIIKWKYESDSEMSTLYYVVKHLKNYEHSIVLYMPYIPNARMDRVKECDEIFTLKYFAEFINSLGFESVFVKDPHSSVSCALINNLRVDNCFQYIIQAVTATKDKNLVIYYPDEGAMKRYSDIPLNKPYSFGIKRRDWRTGEIKGITLMDEDIIKGKNVLIVDDICSKGGTFFHSAKALKNAGAGDIYLYVTHCENTVFKGELINSNLIKHIFTTDSIFSLTHNKITVL